ASIAHNPDGTPTFPVPLNPTLYGPALLTAVAVGIASAGPPARRAARMDPADALRHGRPPAAACRRPQGVRRPRAHAGAARDRFDAGGGRVRRAHRPFRLGEEHAAEPGRAARPPHERRGIPAGGADLLPR